MTLKDKSFVQPEYFMEVRWPSSIITLTRIYLIYFVSCVMFTASINPLSPMIQCAIAEILALHGDRVNVAFVSSFSEFNFISDVNF